MTAISWIVAGIAGYLLLLILILMFNYGAHK